MRGAEEQRSRGAEEQRSKGAEERVKSENKYHYSLFTIHYSLSPLFSLLFASYRRESKDLRRGTKSAINYVHLLTRLNRLFFDD